MKLISMMDSLLRDRESLYRGAHAGDLGRLCIALLVVFVLTSAIYGAVAGSFRLFHPEYFFSDYELTVAEDTPITGKIAGVNLEKATVYTAISDVSYLTDMPVLGESEIRFNITRPSDAYHVVSVGEEGGYGAIELASESVLEETNGSMMPLLVAGKTPLLFLLTLAICSLALYVLNLAFDIGLHFMPVITAAAFGLAATGVMLGVFVPIVGLFTIVTESYHFMKVLHVIVFAVAGAFGVKVLYEGLMRLAPEAGAGVKKLLFAWILLYCLVGGQLAWTLKPFLGTPYLPATPPFRVESGNIYVSFFSSLGQVPVR
jgi:hypothetical protein